MLACPLCSLDLTGLSTLTERQRHVNACLDAPSPTQPSDSPPTKDASASTNKGTPVKPAAATPVTTPQPPLPTTTTTNIASSSCLSEADGWAGAFDGKFSLNLGSDMPNQAPRTPSAPVDATRAPVRPAQWSPALPAAGASTSASFGARAVSWSATPGGDSNASDLVPPQTPAAPLLPPLEPPPQATHSSSSNNSSGTNGEVPAVDAEQLEWLTAAFPGVPAAHVAMVLAFTGGDAELAAQLLCEETLSPASPSGYGRQGHNNHRRRRDRDNNGDAAGTSDSVSDEEGAPAFPSSSSSAAAAATGRRGSGVPVVVPANQLTSPVEVVIYDIAPDSVGKKFGLGVYHSGVVVYGREYAFGGSQNPADNDKPGVFHTRPYSAAAVVKKKIPVGTTAVTKAELLAWIASAGRDAWKIGRYHLLTRNCNHFAEALLTFLGERVVLPSEETEGAAASPSSSAAVSSSSSDAGGSDDGERGAAGGAARRQRRLLKAREAFALPPWVNRAARVGSTVVPDFVFRKIMQKMQEEAPQAVPAASPEAKPATTAAVKADAEKQRKGASVAPATAVSPVAAPAPSVSPPVVAAVVLPPPDPQAVDAVRAVLPHVSPEAAAAALAKTRGRLDAAVDLLLSGDIA